MNGGANKDKERASVEGKVEDAKGEPMTAEEMIDVNAGKSRTAEFKKQVMRVKTESSDPSIATAAYSDDKGMTIKGIKAGSATITVRAEVVRYITNIPKDKEGNTLQQDVPYTLIYHVEVVPSDTI